MKDKFISTKDEVEQFITDINKICSMKKFNIDRDFDLLLKYEPDNIYSTQNTLLQLDFDRYDVLNEIKNLKVSDYVETAIDRKDNTLPNLFIFNKKIQGKDIYIKVKIRNINNNKIFCISFHFARYDVKFFPYK